MTRNLRQTQVGGFDLDGIDWLAPEIKHHETLNLNAWWDQTLRQAVDNREPVLIYKSNNVKWRVRMFGKLEIEPGRRLKTVVDISWDAFAIWFEKRLAVELSKDTTPAEVAETTGGLFPLSQG